MRSNCLIWAIGKLAREGGYIAFRRTRRGQWRWLALWPHVLWSPDLVSWFSYVPLENARGAVVPPLLFRGKVVEGD